MVSLTLYSELDANSRIRPVNTLGARVPPDELHAHRRTHEVRFPECLCNSRFSYPAHYEAAIFCVERGHLAGLWVAACARGHCGYLGKSVH